MNHTIKCMVNKTLNSTPKSTIKRKKIKESILKILGGSDKPLSTAEIGFLLKRSWHTIIRYCLDLENEQKLIKFEVGRISVWQLKKVK